MTLQEIVAAARVLPASDKLRLIRILAEELETGHEIAPLELHKEYALPTPYDAFGAAQVLMDAMRAFLRRCA